MKILKLWKGGQISGKISTSGNFLPKKFCFYDGCVHQFEIVDMKHKNCCQRISFNIALHNEQNIKIVAKNKFQHGTS